jgi:Trypsin-like peptidase domain
MKPHRSLLAVVAFLAAPALGLGPRLTAEDLDPEALYKKVVKSTVFIITPMKGGFAMGSGSLIDADKRLILTNYHVVDEEQYVYVQFPIFVKDTMITDKEQYIQNAMGKVKTAPRGKVLCRDKSRDLAIIELPKIPSGTQALPLARKSANRNETVWNIGNPGAVDQVFSVTRGEVRSVAVEDHLVGGGDGSAFRIKCMLVTTTNPVNPGDSGGPLVNKKGEQVAVTESGRRGASLVNRFVDVSEVRALLKEQKIKIKELTPEPEDKPDSLDPGTPPVTPKKDSGSSPVVAPKKDAAGPSAEAEKAADELLRRARLFANDDDNKDRYISILKEILKKYPGTAAAKEADKRLKANN